MEKTSIYRKASVSSTTEALVKKSNKKQYNTPLEQKSQSVNKITKETILSLTEKYKRGDLMRNKTIAELDYGPDEESYITPATIKTLSKILGTPAEFARLTAKERKARQIELNKLNKDEYIWKTTIKRTTHDPSACSQLYPDGYNRFKESITHFVFPDPTVTKKKSQNFLPYKARIMVRGLASELVLAGHPIFESVAEMSDLELDKAFESISIFWIFNDVCRIILKKASDNIFNNLLRESKKYQDTVTNNILAAKTISVEYDFRIVFAMYLFNLAMNYIAEKKKIIFDYKVLGKIISRHLRSQEKIYVETCTYWRRHSDSVQSILSAIQDCEVFEVKTDIKPSLVPSNVRTTKKYVVPLYLSRNHVSYTKFPWVVKGDPVTEDSFQDLVKPIFKGKASITFSDKFRRTLNASKDKKYAINDTYLSILSSFYETEDPELIRLFEACTMPFPYKKEVKKAADQLAWAKEHAALESVSRHVIEQIQIQIVGKGQMQKPKHTQCLLLSGSTVLEMEVNAYVFRCQQKLTALMLEWKWAGTILQLANCYRGFPIYITDSMCSRGRLFPEQPLISWTSGVFKHLLREYTEHKVTIPGFVALMQAYYKPSKELRIAFSEFLRTEFNPKYGFKQLSAFFRDNRLDFSITGKRAPYFLLLFSEITDVIKNKRTGVLIEIDQVASGVTLLSCFIRNREMARVSNMIGGPASDPYDHCRSKFAEFYADVMTNRDELAFKFLASSRKAHKYAIMCFCYSQTHRGRSDDLIERFEEEHMWSASKSEKKVLMEFSQNYQAFIHFVFPNTAKQIQIIMKVVDLAARELTYLPFKNLQGESFTWTFYNYRTKNSSAYDPISHKAVKAKHISYKYAEIPLDNDYKGDSEGNTEKRLKTDITTFKRKALAYIIHCIDASLIHRYILWMKEKHHYKINHLHDCVLVHPNYVGAMYDVISEVYWSDELYDMANNLFFNPIRQHLSDDARLSLDNLQKEFEENSDKFGDELKNCNPRNVYEFEG